MEYSVQLSLQGFNAEGKPVTGTVTMKLSYSEIQKLRDIFFAEAIKEEAENLFAKMNVNSKNKGK